MTDNSFIVHVGDGAQQVFPIGFDFLSIDHIVVTLDDVPLTGPGADPTFEWEPFPVGVQFPSLITIHTPPPLNAVLKFQRVTPHDAPFVVFVDDVPITGADLNADFQQVIFYAEEVEDAATNP